MSKGSVLQLLNGDKIPVPPFIVLHEQDIADCEKIVSSYLSQFDDGARFAVRSSANVEDGARFSYAGIFESYLYVRRDEILKFVHKCVATKNSDRVHKYSERNGVKTAILMDVIVQQMIDADVAGVLFCRNPVSHEKEYLIECAHGIGEGIVSGRVSPDRIRYNYIGNQILEYRVGFQEYMFKGNAKHSGTVLCRVPLLAQSKRKICDKQVKRLSYYAQRICELLNAEADIEFCLANEQLYILQARAITT